MQASDVVVKKETKEVSDGTYDLHGNTTTCSKDDLISNPLPGSCMRTEHGYKAVTDGADGSTNYCKGHVITDLGHYIDVSQRMDARFQDQVDVTTYP